jgi:hypothetical protein
MKKFFALAVMLVMCTAFVGCETKPAAKKADAPKTDAPAVEGKAAEGTPPATEGETKSTEEGKTE